MKACVHLSLSSLYTWYKICRLSSTYKMLHCQQYVTIILSKAWLILKRADSVVDALFGFMTSSQEGS